MKSKKVRGSSLFYAIVLSLLIGLVLTGLVSMSYYSTVEFEIHSTPSKLVSNLKNAESILFAQFGNKNEGEWHEVYEIEDPTFYKYQSWGIYQVGKVRSIVRQDTLSSSFLFGQKWSDDGVAIHLKKGISGLNISGRTKLVGNAAVPGGRIKPSFIENQSFQGNQLITGNVTEPKRPFPQLDSQLKTALSSLTTSNLRSMKTHSISELPDSLSHSFLEETQVYYSADSIAILDNQLSGNVILCAERAVYISPFCKADNVIIVAPRIYIADRFSGALQCFATEKINVSENVHLTYPSALVLQGKKTEELNIDSEVYVEGTIIVNKDKEAEKGSLEISNGVKITGLVISNGATQLKGAVHGQVITNEFYLKTGSGFYKNYLLNAEVDVTKLPDWFCGTALQSKKAYPQKIVDL